MGLAAAVAALIAVVAIANLWVLFSPKGESTDDVADVPHAQAAIVLGALVDRDGTMSQMLGDRVQMALELWHTGKVDRLLLSGDHSSWDYDEPDIMRRQLISEGVPGRDIFTDHAGFNTWASMVRARKVFDVNSAVVITQGFHMPRALYLAKAAGLDASGLTSDLHGYAVKKRQSEIREVFSRVKAVGDATLNSGVMLGPEIPITGDGRASWGPAPPAGTPPAGAPRR